MKHGQRILLVVLVYASLAGFVGVVALTGPVTAEELAKHVDGDPDAASLRAST